ncbi:TPA: cell division protein DamX [Klebsiella michiganensis]|jgi:DamX protein|uniref:Cell division protein DamX n=1 Tax=Klebsiella michiganensis TaxID=1134687 RepID=A0A443WK46_9ENTR|nr:MULTISPECIES: cell division protein DamX [Klebsiella]QLW87437.1 cell division protein DamX [Klebsiella oxytoca]EKV5143469.1 cell division protein DamX [Klebsiella michiganensis]ELT9701983.1 cell division protein DamX [Klebsiella michiganensis]ELT9729734.1 cell division protein DamX [Klebsiella michiganensis]ELT9752692.1 cell division protein DamX [Klebsiella michiganensis]
MDELKPEDDMKADRSDRRTGRSRQSSERDADPQINFDDVELDDADDGRPTRGSKARRERDEEQYEEYEEEVESDEDDDEERQVERRPRKRKKAPAKPASRQYIMMGVGILVLLLLIVGVGSALKSPSSSSEQTASGEKSINLSGEQDNNNTQPAAQDSSAANNAQPQDVSLPPIASNPTQGQATAEPQGQQRVEVQGDLNNALTQQQGQIDSAVANSTLPTEPATVAPVRNGTAAPRQATTERQTAATPRPAERKHTVIEPKPQATAKAPTQPKPAAVQPKRVENVATTTPAAAQPTKPAATAQAKPAATTAPAATATTAPAATAAAAPAATAAAGKSAGDVSSMKSAPSGHYTLQLSSSSNYNNLNSWAKKEKLEKYVVYETTRNGQPWYVLVSGIYASKDEAKRAVATLPADVQAKNPWAKPLHQVQSDLK